MQSHKSKLFAFIVIIFTTPVAAIEFDHVYSNFAVGETEFDSSIDGIRIDDESSAYRLLVGYRSGDFPALEIGYINFDELTDNFVDLNASGFTAGTTAYLPLNQSYSIRGRIGLMRWDARFDNGIDPYFSVGFLAQVGRDIALTLDYEVYDVDKYEIQAMLFGVQFYESTSAK